MTLIRRALASAVAAGAILSFIAPAHAEDNDPPTGDRTCIIEYVDAYGNTIRRERVPEGTVVGGVFVCRGGEWTFNFWPFTAQVAGSAGSVAVGPKGQLTDAVIDVDTRGGGLEVREMLSVVEHLFAEAADTSGPAVVVSTVDRREELSPQEYSALLDGREVPGVRVLATPGLRPETTLDQLGESDGPDGAMEKKVVIRLTKNWILVGDLTCTTNKDGSKVCTFKGTIKRG